MNFCNLCLLFSASPFLKQAAWGYFCRASFPHLFYLSSFHPQTISDIPQSTAALPSEVMWWQARKSPRSSDTLLNIVQCQVVKHSQRNMCDERIVGEACLLCLLFQVNRLSCNLRAEWPSTTSRENIILTVGFPGKKSVLWSGPCLLRAGL